MTREFTKTTVNVRLNGGPYGGGSTTTDSLDAFKLVFGPDDKAHAYVNQQDGDYLYSPDLSAHFSRDIRETYEKWAGTTFRVQTA